MAHRGAQSSFRPLVWCVSCHIALTLYCVRFTPADVTPVMLRAFPCNRCCCRFGTCSLQQPHTSSNAALRRAKTPPSLWRMVAWFISGQSHRCAAVPSTPGSMCMCMDRCFGRHLCGTGLLWYHKLSTSIAVRSGCVLSTALLHEGACGPCPSKPRASLRHGTSILVCFSTRTQKLDSS